MKYAIVESGGKQYRAVEGGTIEVDRLPAETGAKIKLEQVLLLADGETVAVGTPLIKDTRVWTTVVEHFKGPKVTIFNYSPKKRIRVKTGHRQNYTRLFVEQIGGSELIKKAAPKVEETIPAEEEEVKKTKAEPKAKPAAAAKKATPAKATVKPAPKKEVKKVPAKTTSKVAPKEKKPAASSTKRTTTTKAEPKKKAPATSPKGKKPAAK
jgi:large subunit ribosomal protein L21